MAKQLKDILKGVKASKVVPGSTGSDPGVDYAPKAPNEQEFVKKHSTEKHADRVGNGDDVYQATGIKHVLASPKEDKHGHKKPNDKAVYESKEQAKCNMTEAGTACPVHEMADCSKTKSLREIAKNPYAIGMAAAMKQTGDKPPLKKSTIVKGHDIAKAVAKEEVEQIDEADQGFDKNSKAHQVAKKTVQDMTPKRSAITKKLDKQAGTTAKTYAKATYHPDGSATIHTTGHPDGLSSARVVDYHHDINKLGHNRPESDYNKRTQKDSHGLTHTTKKTASGHTIHIKEEVEQVDEVSKETLGSYVTKASRQRGELGRTLGRSLSSVTDPESRKKLKTFKNRQKGVERAVNKLVGEEVEQIDELDRQAGSVINRYISKTTDDPKRKEGRNLALKKKWGDKNYGLPEPRVKAVTREEVEQVDETANAPSREKMIKDLHAKGYNAEWSLLSTSKLHNHWQKKTNKNQSVVKKTNEDLAVPLLGGDDESAEMAKTQLRALANKALHLAMQLNDDQVVEPWVQSKIAVAKDHVTAVHDYMVYGDHSKDKEEKESAPYEGGVDMSGAPRDTYPNFSADVNTGRNV